MIQNTYIVAQRVNELSHQSSQSSTNPYLGDKTSLPDGMDVGVRNETPPADDLSFCRRFSMTLRASAGNWLNNESSAGVETKTTQSNSEATTDVVTRSSGGDADDILQSDASIVCLF